MLVSSRFRMGASVLAAFLSVAAFDFFFVPPYLTFAVADFRHATTFTVMFVVAIVISGLTQRVRNEAAAARERELRTATLYELSRELAGAQDSPSVLQTAASHIEKVFRSHVTVFTPASGGGIERVYTTAPADEASEREASIAHWVLDNQREAGLGTGTLPGGATLYVPLVASGGVVGVLGLTPKEPQLFEQIEQRRRVDAFAAQMALAVERAMLADETGKARREIEAEQLRSSLLSSVSHDLRTPLAVITGSTSTLLQGGSGITEATRQDLLKTVLEEAEHLNRLIRNLLDMTRLESGAVKVKKEWLPLEELVGAALNRVDSRLTGRDVHVDLPRELPLVPCDAVLIEQVLINLLENAAKYSTGAIDISASVRGREVVVDVADRGPGIAEGQEKRIFDKFQRAGREGNPEGVGLGLTICRAIVSAHGGRIWVQNRAGGGASFQFALPIEGEAPTLLVSEPGEMAQEQRA
jgi:two-component system sensor histidine kinase KdpD